MHSGADTTGLQGTGSTVTIGQTGVINTFGALGHETSVRLGSAGTLLHPGLIRSSNCGVSIDGAAGQITNAGTIAADATGVTSLPDRTLTNTGTIDGKDDGVVIAGTNGSVPNSGRIASDSSALTLGHSGYMVNSGDMISRPASGPTYAVGVGSVAMIKNSGAIFCKIQWHLRR